MASLNVLAQASLVTGANTDGLCRLQLLSLHNWARDPEWDTPSADLKG